MADKIKVFIISASNRGKDSCAGEDPKSLDLMKRMADNMPDDFEVDIQSLSNVAGKNRIKSCNACVSTSMALCGWPCSCYGPNSVDPEDFMYDNDMYTRFEEADAWAIIGSINWYGPTSNVKAMFDRMVCMDGGNPFPELTDWKDVGLAEELEKSEKWKKLNVKHMEGRTCAFFTYGDGGANEVDEEGYPRNLTYRKAYNPDEEVISDRMAYAGLVATCRWMGIEVPDSLWYHQNFNIGEPYSDNQIEDIPKDIYRDFDAWTKKFIKVVKSKGKVDPPLFSAKEAIKKRKGQTKRSQRVYLVEKLKRAHKNG